MNNKNFDHKKICNKKCNKLQNDTIQNSSFGLYSQGLRYGICFGKNIKNELQIFNTYNKTTSKIITFSGNIDSSELVQQLTKYMIGMKKQLIEILEKDNLLTEVDLDKISQVFDEEIKPDSNTMKKILKDIYYMRSKSIIINNSDDINLILAQDTIPIRFYYEIAHKLHVNNEKGLAMQVAKKSTQKTGAQIYPGAQIEAPVIFSHSIGVVVGNTAHIGPNTTIYQNVSVASSKKLDDSLVRHPNIVGDTTIGAGAILLGKIDIGTNTSIGAGAIVTKDMPNNTIARNDHADIYPKK